MTTVQTEPNPFALLMDPESILAALARSDRLSRLHSRVCRPLDKPLVARSDSDTETMDASAGASNERDD